MAQPESDSPATGRAPVIDVHAHAVLETSLGAAGAAGPEIGTTADGRPSFRVGSYVLEGVRYVGSAFMDVDVRLQAMDRAGIDVQLLSPNPLTYFKRLDVPAAVDFATAHNDALAELVSAHPGRLLGAAQLPMQDLDAAIAELQRAVRDLGLVAAYIDTDPGVPLDHPTMDAFYAAAVELDVPVFVHPSPLGADGPPDDVRVRRFDLDLLFGFARDETLAVATLIMGGVLERHPHLDVCVSHGGGATAYIAGRLRRAVEIPRHWVPDFLVENGFDHYLRRLWLDTHVHSEGALDLLVDVAGPERLVFGSNFSGWDSSDDDLSQAGPLMDRLSANAARLLRL